MQLFFHPKQASLSFLTHVLMRGLDMENSSTGLYTNNRIGVKTRLDVRFAELEHKSLLITTGQFLGPVSQSHAVLY